MKKYITPMIDLILFDDDDVQTISSLDQDVNAWSTLDDEVLTDAGIDTQPRIVNVSIEKVNVF